MDHQSIDIKMTIVITHKEKNPSNGRIENIVSHGIVLETDQCVPLPSVPIKQLRGVVYDFEIGEYVLIENYNDQHE